MAWTRMGLFGLGLGRVRSVFLERACEREFAQAMAHHVFRHEHGIEDLSVVHVEGQPDEVRRDHGAARPCLDRRLGLGVLGLHDFFQQVPVDERSFFNRASHNRSQASFIGRPFRRTTMKRLECFLRWRVLPPLAILPHGDVNCCQPPPDLDLPAPPPFGWSTGLRETPRLMGRMPRWRERPALPRMMFSCSMLPTWPTVARQLSLIRRISPEGSRIWA